MPLTPFADDSASTTIGKLTVENGRDRIALYGSLDLTRDKQGLAAAKALKSLIDQVVQTLDGETLSDAVPPAKPTRKVPNPFA